MLFHSLTGLGRVIIISALAYGALILVLRLAGKRSLGKLNAFDLVVTVALGSTLATVLLSKDIALAEGALAFAMLAGLQFLVTKASVRWRWAKNLVRSKPRLLFRDGSFLEGPMRDERVTHDEIAQVIRQKGFGRIEEVAAVVLETDGSFSVIPASPSEGELTALRSVRGSEPR